MFDNPENENGVIVEDDRIGQTFINPTLEKEKFESEFEGNVYHVMVDAYFQKALPGFDWNKFTAKELVDAFRVHAPEDGAMIVEKGARLFGRDLGNIVADAPDRGLTLWPQSANNKKPRRYKFAPPLDME